MGVAFFGPESSVYPAAGFSRMGAVLANPLARKYMAEGDGFYEDHRLMQQAMADFAKEGGGEFWVLPPEPSATQGYSFGGTIEIPSGLTVQAMGRVTIKAKDQMNVPLFKFADNGADYGLVGGFVLDGNAANMGGGGRLVTIGANARRVAIDIRGVNVLSGVVAAGGVSDLRIGSTRGYIDPQAMGALANAALGLDGQVTSGQAVLTSASAPFTSDMVGWTVEVQMVGGLDYSGVARRSLLTTVASYQSPTQVTLATVAQATATAARFAVYRDDSARLAEASALASLARAPIRLGPTNYVGSIVLGGKGALEGAGPNLSVLRAPLGATAVAFINGVGGHLKNMTVEGYGPDAGADLGSGSTGFFQGAVTAMWFQQLHVMNVHARFAQNGFQFTNAADNSVDIPTRYLFLDNLFASSITTHNGTAGGIGGVGFWFFNRVRNVEAGNLRSNQTGKHGLYVDAGSSNGPQTALSHGLNEDFDIANATAVSPGSLGPQDGLSSTAVGVGVQGGDRIRIGQVSVNAPLDNADGMAIGGDQNGETSRDCWVGRAELVDVGALPLSIQGLRNKVGSVLVRRFNRPSNSQPGTAQSASYQRPVVFNHYPSYSVPVAGMATPLDTQDCEIGELDIFYDGPDAAMFDYASAFIGGTLVPTGVVRAIPSVTDGAITSGTRRLTSATAAFVAGDRLSQVTVAGAGVAAATLTARIIRVISATDVDLDTPASTTVAAAATTIRAMRRGITKNNRIRRVTARTPNVGLATYATITETFGDGAIALGSTLFDSIDAAFDQADERKAITVFGAGVAGGDLVSSIKRFVSATRVELVDVANTAVSTAGMFTITARTRYNVPYGPEGNYVGTPTERTTPQARQNLTVGGGANVPTTSGSLLFSLDGSVAGGAITVAVPGALSSGENNGTRLEFTAATAHAHVVTIGGGLGLNGGGAAVDRVTLGGAIGDAFVIEVRDGVWWLVSGRNITLS